MEILEFPTFKSSSRLRSKGCFQRAQSVDETIITFNIGSQSFNGRTDTRIENR